MSGQELNDDLLQYLMLIVLLTFHEYGHAWVAWRCGDDTAYRLGRVSLNPIVHIDPIGTVLMPLMMMILPHSVGRFLIGGAKPVPVNPYNLRNPTRDDLLVTLAGPGMNVALAVIIIGIARLIDAVSGVNATAATIVGLLGRMAELSLYLCFFNLLLPIPPLDGSRVARVLLNISHEDYARFARFGFIPVIIAINIRGVMEFIAGVTEFVFNHIARGFGFN